MGNEVRKRIEWIDISKGIGVFLLVLGHMPTLPYAIQNWIYSFHMPLFFAVSGFTYKNKGSFRIEVKKSFQSLMIPYFIYSVVFFMSDVLLFGTGHTIVKDDLTNIISGQGSFGVIWFLLSMFWVRVIYSFIEKVDSERIKTLIVFILALFGYIISVFTALDLYKIITSMVAVSFFYSGTLLRKYNVIQSLYEKKYGIMYIVGLFIISIILSYLNLKIYGLRIELSGARYNFLPLTYICAICGVMAIMVSSCFVSNFKIFVVSIVKHIGRYSLWYFALTAYIPTRIMNLIEITQWNNTYIKILSKIIGFVMTFVIIKFYYFIKGKVFKVNY